MTAPRTPRGLAGRWPATTGLLAVLVLALGVRLALWSLLDLSDTPGPGSALFLSRALQDRPQPEPYVLLVQALAPGCGGVVEAGWLLALLGSLGVVLGTGLAGWGLGSWEGGPVAAALAALWALSVQPALQVGPDGPALGLAALGVGVAWAGTRRLPGLSVGVGVALVAAAVALKAVAAPAWGLVALAVPLAAPLAGRGALRAALGGGVVLAALVWSGHGPQSVLPGAGAPGWVQEGGLSRGLGALVALETRGWTTGVLVQVLLAAGVASLVPGRGQSRRLLAAVGVGLLVLAVAGMGEARLRPRYLLSVGMGAVAVLGAGLAALPAPRVRGVAVAVALALLGLDLWAWVEAVDRIREAELGVRAAALPSAPGPWARRHARLPSLLATDTSVRGAVPLLSALDAAPVGVAVVPLRDGRHHHALLGAQALRRTAVVLEPRACCPGSAAGARCAARVVRAVEAAGLDLVLPSGGDSRVDAPLRPWVAALETASAGEERGGWTVRRAAGAGEGGPLPCGLVPGQRRPGPPLLVTPSPR